MCSSWITPTKTWHCLVPLWSIIPYLASGVTINIDPIDSLLPWPRWRSYPDVQRAQQFCKLWPCDTIWHQSYYLFNTDSCNGVLSDGTKPLHGPKLTSHQWVPVAFTCRQFHKKIKDFTLKNILKFPHLKSANGKDSIIMFKICITKFVQFFMHSRDPFTHIFPGCFTDTTNEVPPRICTRLTGNKTYHRLCAWIKDVLYVTYLSNWI